MALKKPAGKFEENDNTTVAAPQAPAVEAPKVTDSAAASASVKASTAVATVSANSIAVGQKLETLFAGSENAIPKVDYGVLTRLVATSGGVQNKSENAMIGDRIKVELISWNKQFVISPGTDDKDDTELVRYSADGITIDDTGEDVKAYLAALRAKDYPDANVKEYAEVIGILKEVSKADKVVASELVDSMVQVSLSPTSRKLFEGYRLQESVKMRLNPGREASAIVVFKADTRTQNGNTFTFFKSSAQ